MWVQIDLVSEQGQPVPGLMCALSSKPPSPSGRLFPTLALLQEALGEPSPPPPPPREPLVHRCSSGFASARAAHSLARLIWQPPWPPPRGAGGLFPYPGCADCRGPRPVHIAGHPCGFLPRSAWLLPTMRWGEGCAPPATHARSVAMEARWGGGVRGPGACLSCATCWPCDLRQFRDLSELCFPVLAQSRRNGPHHLSRKAFLATSP